MPFNISMYFFVIMMTFLRALSAIKTFVLIPKPGITILERVQRWVDTGHGSEEDQIGSSRHSAFLST